MSREELSLDISRLVSRVVSGESIDTAERGAALAAKYPDLGMSGALIGQAIERAAGMVGLIRNAPEPVKPPPLRATEPPAASQAVASDAQPVNGDVLNGQPANGHRLNGVAVAPFSLPVAAQSIDDDLAAAIDAEIGSLVSGHTSKAPPAKPSGGIVGPAAAIVARTSNGTRAVRSAPVRAEEETHTAAVPLQAASVSEKPVTKPPPPGSIFSNFRRALFRT